MNDNVNWFLSKEGRDRLLMLPGTEVPVVEALNDGIIVADRRESGMESGSAVGGVCASCGHRRSMHVVDKGHPDGGRCITRDAGRGECRCRQFRPLPTGFRRRRSNR